MKTNLRLLFTLLFVVSVVALRAGTMNDIRVSGTVVSEGDPLPGVSVLVKGTSVGTITGIDGKYSINVPSDGTLVFSFIGLKSVEHKVGGRSVINVELVPDSKQLEEVMVVAYATAKKYSFTGAASTVKGDEIAKLQTSSVSRALEGTVAGLQASAASGQPGTDATIRIRGIGSINASSAPLYVVDGVPYDGSVNSINPEDIASMTVLKDAASAALYGSRGANGVIIITTKQGQSDSKTTVNVKASFGGSNRAVRDYDRIGTHAADAAVILGRPVAGVIIQILRELRSADARQPAAYIIGVSLPVRVGAVQRLRLQTTKVIISIGSKRHLRPSQCMLHLGEPVCMVIAVSVCFRPAVLPACRVRMRHRGRLVRKGIDRGCHVVPVTESVPLQVSMLLYEIPCLHPT